MLYQFKEVLNDLVNYFMLGDILLLEEWKQANKLSDDLGVEFTSNESGDRAFHEGIVIPMTGIENYPYTVIFNLSNNIPELCKKGSRLQFRRGGYALKVENHMLLLFTWPILEHFTHANIEKLINYYKQHNKPLIELPNAWYDIEILGGERIVDDSYEPTFEFLIQASDQKLETKADLNCSFEIRSSTY